MRNILIIDRERFNEDLNISSFKLICSLDFVFIREINGKYVPLKNRNDPVFREYDEADMIQMVSDYYAS